MNALPPSSFEEAGAKSEASDATGFGMVLITIITPATATPSVIHGSHTRLSVLGEDLLGESMLRYTWAVASGPAAAQVEFAENRTNAAKNTTATFSEPGRYAFSCTITNGLFGLVSCVEVLVEEIPALLAA